MNIFKFWPKFLFVKGKIYYCSRKLSLQEIHYIGHGKGLALDMGWGCGGCGIKLFFYRAIHAFLFFTCVRNIKQTNFECDIL